MNAINTDTAAVAANAMATNLHRPPLRKPPDDAVPAYSSTALLSVAIFDVSWYISPNQATDINVKRPITNSI